MKDLKSFNGKRLKTARTLKGMSISELAEALDLQRQTVSMYESGKISNPDFPKVQRMSQLLNFPIDFFLGSDTELVLHVEWLFGKSEQPHFYQALHLQIYA